MPGELQKNAILFGANGAIVTQMLNILSYHKPFDKLWIILKKPVMRERRKVVNYRFT